MRRLLSFAALAALSLGALGLGATQAQAQVIVTTSGVAPVSYYYPSYGYNYATFASPLGYQYNYATVATPLGYQYGYNYWATPGYSSLASPYNYNPILMPGYVPSSQWYWNRYAPAVRRYYGWGWR
jgi:hypothetical protein